MSPHQLLPGQAASGSAWASTPQKLHPLTAWLPIPQHVVSNTCMLPSAPGPGTSVGKRALGGEAPPSSGHRPRADSKPPHAGSVGDRTACTLRLSTGTTRRDARGGPHVHERRVAAFKPQRKSGLSLGLPAALPPAPGALPPSQRCGQPPGPLCSSLHRTLSPVLPPGPSRPGAGPGHTP